MLIELTEIKKHEYYMKSSSDNPRIKFLINDDLIEKVFPAELLINYEIKNGSKIKLKNEKELIDIGESPQEILYLTGNFK